MTQEYTFEQVQALLYEAGRTRQAQSVPGCWPSEFRSGMPEVGRDPEDLKYAETEYTPPQPSTAEVTLADMVEGWIRGLAGATPVEIRRRKILLDGMQVDPRTDQPRFSWGRLGRKHGLTAEEAERVWYRGVDLLVIIANRSAAHTTVGMAARIRVASLRPLPVPCAETIRRIRAASARATAELQPA